MLPVSQAATDEIRGDIDTAELNAVLGFLPDGAKEGGQVYTSTALLDTDQLNDGIETMGAKWMSLEGRGDNARIRLDGSYQAMYQADFRQTGQWLWAYSDADGQFADPKPWVQYTLDKPYDIVGTTITFDDAGGEWATSVTIEYSTGTTKTVICTSAKLETELTAAGVEWIKFTINAWNKPHRHPKIVEIHPGIFYRFDGNNSMSFDISEEIAPFSSVIMPQSTLEFDNQSLKFDIINPQGVAGFLRQRMKLASSLQVADTSISVGDWFLHGWSTESNTETGFFQTRPVLSFLTGNYLKTPGTQTVQQAADIILAGYDYTIDPALSGIIVNTYIGESVPFLSALSQLAVAAGGYWHITRDNTLRLSKIEATTPVRTLTYDQIFGRPSITQLDYVTGVYCKYYQVVEDSSGRRRWGNVTVLVGDETGTVPTISSAFVPTEARAMELGAQILEYYQRRIKYTVTAKGDPTLEVGDTITVQHDYGMVDIMITNLRTTWGSGILETRIEGVG